MCLYYCVWYRLGRDEELCALLYISIYKEQCTHHAKRKQRRSSRPAPQREKKEVAVVFNQNTTTMPSTTTTTTCRKPGVCDMTEAGKVFLTNGASKYVHPGVSNRFFTPKRRKCVASVVFVFSNKRHEIIYRCYTKLSYFSCPASQATSFVRVWVYVLIRKTH